MRNIITQKLIENNKTRKFRYEHENSDMNTYQDSNLRTRKQKIHLFSSSRRTQLAEINEDPEKVQTLAKPKSLENEHNGVKPEV